ncbi:hypothetical protein IL306_006025 [Fusarium sp. DS 682]|nr:hypothetical protein IL306_006025 [Fusarium sp. DS 682]
MSIIDGTTTTTGPSERSTTTSADRTTTAGESTTADETTSSAAETTTTAAATTATCFPTIVLANPTALFGPEEIHLDEYASVELPFQVSIYGSFSNTIYAATNGVLSILQTPEVKVSGNWYLPLKEYLPDVSILPYWSDQYIWTEFCGSGIWYEVHETTKGQTFTVEYSTVPFVGNGIELNHYSVSLYKDYPGLVRYEYYPIEC